MPKNRKLKGTLRVKLLTATAKAPTVATPGEDIAFDIYADEDVLIPPGEMRMISTGIAVELISPRRGLVYRDRSSMAKMYALTVGGVIDAGYRGEAKVMMHNRNKEALISIKKGEKIAQMLPMPVVTDRVVVVRELSSSKRGEKGFGSSGK
jgi:dUTP pyrophosphatase